MRKMTKILIAICILTVFAAGCAAKYTENKGNEIQRFDGSIAEKDNGLGSYYNSASKDEADKIEDEKGNVKPGNKIIKSGSVVVETLQFDKTINAVVNKVNEFGGYIESSNIQGKSKYSYGESLREASYVLRIPSDKFDQFLSDAGELGNVLRTQNHGQDISDLYYDTEARLKSLELQEKRLLDILEDAEKLSDVIELERELSKVRTEIEQHTGSLRKWDNLVDYSKVELIIHEVKELKEDDPSTIWEKIERGFKASVKNVGIILESSFVFIVSSIPYFLIIGILGIVVYSLIKLIRKKSAKEKRIK